MGNLKDMNQYIKILIIQAELTLSLVSATSAGNKYSCLMQNSVCSLVGCCQLVLPVMACICAVPLTSGGMGVCS